MNVHRKSFKKGFLIAALIVVFLIACILLPYLLRIHNYNKQKQADIELLTTSEYDSIFCSMYSVKNFAQEDFVTYRGCHMLKLQTSLRNPSDMGEFLSAAFASDNTIGNIYLGLDPAQINPSSRDNIDNILSYVSSHPDVTFEILLSAPPMEYWLEKSSTETEELLASYLSNVNILESYSNVITYFLGNEQWLIANPASYTNPVSFEFNDTLSKHLLLSCFCDKNYQITLENAPTLLNDLKEQIVSEQSSPSKYPDLSNWDIVFFGDSIIGNYTGSYSVPGVVTGLSGAHTYNCAQGGISAGQIPGSPLDFPRSVDYFIAQTPSAITVNGPFQASLEQYIRDDHTDHKLCFVLNFGLNDYFSGLPVENAEDSHDMCTYAGALREGISKLQSAYPDATILLMTPTFSTIFSCGTEKLTEKGDTLTKYVDAAQQVANEMNVICLHNYVDMGIDETNASVYLLDGVHLNAKGRFLLGTHIIRQLSSDK